MALAEPCGPVSRGGMGDGGSKIVLCRQVGRQARQGQGALREEEEEEGGGMRDVGCGCGHDDHLCSFASVLLCFALFCSDVLGQSLVLELQQLQQS